LVEPINGQAGVAGKKDVDTGFRRYDGKEEMKRAGSDLALFLITPHPEASFAPLTCFFPLPDGEREAKLRTGEERML